MDTAALIISNQAFANHLVKKLRQIGEPNSKPKKWRGKGFKRGYENGAVYKVLGKHLFIAWKPRVRKKTSPFPPLPPMLMNFHLSQFEDFNAFKKWGTAVFGKDGLSLVLDGRLKRLDFAIDVEMHIDIAEQEIIQSRARTERRIKSGKKTIYLGSYPRETRIYEREIPRYKLDHKTQKNNDPGEIINAIRIEVECHAKKIPIKCLRGVEFLRTWNPFSHLQYLNQRGHVISTGAPPKVEQKLMAFKWCCQQMGAQAARKKFNKDRNFARTVEKYFDDVGDFDFEKAWKKRINRFLGPSPVKFPDLPKSFPRGDV